ncbi:hypothetical protein B0H10DRAFT_933718 [Mycena sp. CBHHK59/15]|nr:hypothetical protein B0H10DRAFT_933718 [Mycena sp. CBHHK59/15]
MGCWTCRVRRKKCDETGIGDLRGGDQPACQTCSRLKMDCIWEKPDWSENKQRVKQFREQKTTELTVLGLVRNRPGSVAGADHTLHTERGAAAEIARSVAALFRKPRTLREEKSVLVVVAKVAKNEWKASTRCGPRERKEMGGEAHAALSDGRLLSGGGWTRRN